MLKQVITGKKAALPEDERLGHPSSIKVCGSDKSSFETASPMPTPMAPTHITDESRANLKEACGDGKLSFAATPTPATMTTAAPTAPCQLMDERTRINPEGTDLGASGGLFMGDMEEDSDDVIKGFSTFEPDGRSIDEIFDFKESII